jgi:chemotaxis-related protein WspB
MLFILFEAGGERYAIEARRVVEVAPLLGLKKLPRAPRGLAGVFNYRGRAVPAIDVSQLTVEKPAAELLSTRIIIVNFPDGSGEDRLVGLIAERATEMLRKDPHEFRDPGIELPSAPFLGPVLLEPGRTVQWIREQNLLPDQLWDFVSQGEEAKA